MSIRLSQIQDIAGCRAVVPDIAAQERALNAIQRLYPAATLFDRRRHPSHGYRAVHVVVREDGKPVEVQLRTVLQHAWAEMCEKFADVIDPAIKYGGGPPDVQASLSKSAALIVSMEALESVVGRTGAACDDIAEELRDVRAELADTISKLLRDMSLVEPKDLS